MARDTEVYVECHEGWKHLYRPLIDLAAIYKVNVVQVKEKFGGLRFYVVPRAEANPDQVANLEKLIKAAEAASYHTCEFCGEDGVTGFINNKPTYRVRTMSGKDGTKGWIRSLCDACRDKL